MVGRRPRKNRPNALNGTKNVRRSVRMVKNFRKAVSSSVFATPLRQAA